MAAVLVLEPIFEADLQPEQYAYRKDHSALDAVRHVHKLINTGHGEIVDADLSSYFVAVVCWYCASIYGTSARKGKAMFAAALLGGSGIRIATLMLLLYQWHLPVFEAEGNIGVASVHSGRHVRTDLLIHTFSGGDIALHASGGSPYFRRDEHVKVRYQGETGAVLSVLFVAADGREEGAFNGSQTWPLFFFLLFGAFIIFQGFWRYRRDPEGAEEPFVLNKHPYGSIDERSLLNLSDQGPDESEPHYEPK
jgi:hypothetical protein